MSLSNSQYENIMRIYNRLNINNRHILEQRKKEIYTSIPRIREIDMEVNNISCQHAIQRVQHHSTSFSLKDKLTKLKDEKTALLLNKGYPSDYLEKQFTCNKCKDTGYVGENKCSCFLKYQYDLLNDEYGNLQRIIHDSFNNFSFDYYSDTIENDKVLKTSKELAKRAYNKCEDFAKNFNPLDENYDNSKNLFIYGETGLGKTLLSNAVASAISQRGYSVIYRTSHQLLDSLSQRQNSYTEYTTIDNPILDCDLLVIDDLGTEARTKYNISLLFTTINQRINNKKSTIISTNENIDEIKKHYTARISSRIIENYTLLFLSGKDIRIKKKTNNN